MIKDVSTPMAHKFASVRDLWLVLGFTHPSEKCKARMANLLRFRGTADPDAWGAKEWTEHLDRFKAAVKPNRDARLAGRQFLADYPDNPEALRARCPASYGAAYGSEGPSNADVPELGMHMFCRKSADAWKAAEKEKLMVLPSSDVAAATETALKSLFGNISEAITNASASASSSASWQGGQRRQRTL